MNQVHHRNPTWIKRLLNYIIDMIVIVVLFVLLLWLLPIALSGVSFDFTIDVNLILILIYFLYYLVLEGITNKTVGKYITKTKVVTNTRRKPQFSQIIARTLVRLLFIEFVSYFSERPVGWHDKVSRTEVVNDFRE